MKILALTDNLEHEIRTFEARMWGKRVNTIHANQSLSHRIPVNIHRVVAIQNNFTLRVDRAWDSLGQRNAKQREYGKNTIQGEPLLFG
jgi:hypothetical protein